MLVTGEQEHCNDTGLEAHIQMPTDKAVRLLLIQQGGYRLETQNCLKHSLNRRDKKPFQMHQAKESSTPCFSTEVCMAFMASDLLQSVRLPTLDDIASIRILRITQSRQAN